MEGDWGSDPFEESMEEEEPEEPGFDDSNGFYPPGFKRDPRFRYGSRPMEKPKDFIGWLNRQDDWLFRSDGFYSHRPLFFQFNPQSIRIWTFRSPATETGGS